MDYLELLEELKSELKLNVSPDLLADVDAPLFSVPEGVTSEEGCTILKLDYLNKLWKENCGSERLDAEKREELAEMMERLPDDELKIVFASLHDPDLIKRAWALLLDERQTSNLLGLPSWDSFWPSELIGEDAIMPFYDAFYDEDLEKPASEQPRTRHEILLSEEARYIVGHYLPLGKNECGTPLYQEDETAIMAALLGTLQKEELKDSGLVEYLQHTPLSMRAEFLLRDDEKKENVIEKQLPIGTLINHFKNHVKGKRAPARWQLQKRFDGQSFTDQVRIVQTFLAGTRLDREWCYNKMLRWWDDALIPDLEQAWVAYRDEKCVKVAATRLPKEFIKAHQRDMEKVDYKSVCYRLACDKDFTIDKSRLTSTDFCYVISHHHMHISDHDADQLLFGHIQNMLTHWRHATPYRFYTYHGRQVYDNLEKKKQYKPSLLYLQSVGYIVWTLGQTGNAKTLIKFHQWNKALQQMTHVEEEESGQDLLKMMDESFGEYQRWNWSIFAKHALKSVPDYGAGFPFMKYDIY